MKRTSLALARRKLNRTLVLGLFGSAAILCTSSLPHLSCSGAGFIARYNALRGDAYELDAVDRAVSQETGVECPDMELIAHRGEKVRYEPTLKVAPAFRERLLRFEQLLETLAVRHYGRAPAAITNAGAYSCRSVRHRAYRLSEHALGNALDLVGFRFGPAIVSKDASVPAPAPELRSAFRVNLVDAWKPEHRHHAFVRDLVEALAAERVFRAMLGPAHEAHRDAGHFHFDYGPWHIIQL
ncbi:MAG TPA: extensin family protein [Polyangiaceae bacterium]|nr:extensin family protein [Polyangiaceae bacterium]